MLYRDNIIYITLFFSRYLNYLLTYFDFKKINADIGFNRWNIPPLALAIHLCIGSAYSFSVFWIPLSKSIGIEDHIFCDSSISIIRVMFESKCDWRIKDISVIYTMFFIFLGSSAAIFGEWVERVGPRKAGVTSAVFWCGGLLISAIGIAQHQLWILLLGSGVIGGIGLGIGYIAPISTLVKWFPDRRGMATGMAIMGFGGGAMIGAPLSNILINFFSGPDSVGVWQTFIVISIIHFLYMIIGSLRYKVPIDVLIVNKDDISYHDDNNIKDIRYVTKQKNFG